MHVDDLPAEIQPQAHTGAVTARVGLVEVEGTPHLTLGLPARGG
jgi:hypothetical protein